MTRSSVGGELEVLPRRVLVVVPGGKPEDPDVVADLLAASDVLGTGWFGAVAAAASEPLNE